MKILYIGTVNFSLHALQKIISLDANIVGVCTLQSSSFNSDHVDLASVCSKHMIPYHYANDINSTESITWIKEKNPDIIFCFGWSRLLKKEILTLPKMGVVGFHPAALPNNRGRHPIIWALVLGLSRTASTFFFMDENADSGDILSQESIDITIHDNAHSLYKKITDTALLQIENFLPKLINNNFKRIQQNHLLANTWRKRNKEDGKIDWRMSASSIHNLVRGLSKPYIGAHFLWQDKEIKVWNSIIHEDAPDNFEPGKVIKVSDMGIIVKCGEKAICLSEIAPSIDAKVGDYL